MNRVILWCAIVALVLLHHDFWWWNDSTLALGVLPVGLAYHMGFSIASALLWAWAVRHAWPVELEEFASRPPDTKAKPAP